MGGHRLELRLPDPPDTVVLGCTHFPLLSQELSQVLPDGTRMIDSGSAIARRAHWLIETSHVDIPEKKAGVEIESVAYCMAMTAEAQSLLPVLQSYGFRSIQELPL